LKLMLRHADPARRQNPARGGVGQSVGGRHLELARARRLRRCSDSGSYLRDLLRRWRVCPMPARDPIVWSGRALQEG
jgi:hypothetical protein